MQQGGEELIEDWAARDRMNAEFQKIISQLEALKAHGNESIRLEPLLDALTKMQTSEVSRSWELLVTELNHNTELEHFRSERESFRQLLEATMLFAGGALKAAILINGGAAVACLAYAGNTKEPQLLPPLLLFSGGVLSAAVAHGMAYLAQFNYSFGKDKEGVFFRGVTMTLIILAYLFFAVGALLGFVNLGGMSVCNLAGFV